MFIVEAEDEDKIKLAEKLVYAIANIFLPNALKDTTSVTVVSKHREVCNAVSMAINYKNYISHVLVLDGKGVPVAAKFVVNFDTLASKHEPQALEYSLEHMGYEATVTNLAIVATLEELGKISQKIVLTRHPEGEKFRAMVESIIRHSEDSPTIEPSLNSQSLISKLFVMESTPSVMEWLKYDMTHLEKCLD